MGSVVSVNRDKLHQFSKASGRQITLVTGKGVLGDAHCGETVQHRSRVAKDPSQPNLRQVHLIHEELFAELREKGFAIAPGDLGENITTRNIDLLGLPRGTKLKIGADAIIEITGLRNPCLQLDRFSKGLMQAVLSRDENSQLIRKAGVMAIVERGGTISIGDQINLELPPAPRIALNVV
ncbi:MOSC domain-containing protein [Parasphingorhabdus halotolerans]|uniref:MOSC domain-containing protein n=1 Tax=Parasphingorhabdus halotolerans TaxID=2725558 RepID=A0A6H2DMP8_9SPHN|nr:MOSC domain-containing protein [Parasphingorhabdus halotolerans]QJB69407.1 MOSC domain-containing protein [Parasphingorhabdus halotolerans]